MEKISFALDSSYDNSRNQIESRDYSNSQFDVGDLVYVRGYRLPYIITKVYPARETVEVIPAHGSIESKLIVEFEQLEKVEGGRKI